MAVTDALPPVKPVPRRDTHPADRQHHRHLDQHADHRRERGARLRAEERDRAVATASSKKLLAPMSAPGAATLCGTFSHFIRP